MKYIILNLIFGGGTLHSVIGQNYADTLNRIIEAIYQKSELPGFSVSIMDATGVLYSKGYGYANKEKMIPYTEYTTQPIASISKTFIALALMKTIEEGHFTLETPVNKILPFKVTNPYFPNDTIRIKHLATHTSGILDGDIYWSKGYFLLEPPQFEDKAYTEAEREFFQMILPNKRIDDKTFIRDYLTLEGKWYSTDHFSNTSPGSNYEYCNIGAALTAYIVETAQKKTYSEYLRQTVFQHLKMTSTNWEFDPPVDPKKEAIQYLNNGDPCPSYSFSTYADGAIRSSVFDLQKYLVEMIKGSVGEGQLVDKNSYKMMFTQILDIDESDGMGLFWFTQKRLGDKFHQGSGAGITTVISFNPADQLGCMILCNHETDNEQQSEAYVAIWKVLIKYRRLLTNGKRF